LLQIIVHILLVISLVYLGVCLVYFLFQERFIFVPTLKTDPFTSKIGSYCEEHFINTPYNGKIHALHLTIENPKGIIFYLHGNTGNLKRWQFMAEEISSYGYDVFAIDYRGYGRSRGKRSEAILHRDVEHCFDYIQTKYKNKKIIIYGRSLGCAFATRLASRRESDKLILETPFYNMHATGRYYLPFLPVKFLLRYHFRSDLYIKNVNTKVYIYHGTSDIIVPHSHALRLYQTAMAADKSVTLTTIPGGKHSNLSSFPLFRKHLEQVLD